MGFALVPGDYSSKLRAQLARSHNNVCGLQVRELRGYRRHLLCTSQSRIGLLPLLLLQKFKEVLKVEALAPIQGALMAIDRTQEPLEPTCEFEKFAPRLFRFNGRAHTGMDATGRPRGEVATAAGGPLSASLTVGARRGLIPRWQAPT